MIIRDTLSDTGHAQRELIITDDSAELLSQSLGVKTLSDLGPEQVRSLYSSLQDTKNAAPTAPKTRHSTEHGEIELNKADLGEELYAAMLPEQTDPDGLRFDPLYSTVEFTMKVMTPQDSRSYIDFCEGRNKDLTTQQFNALIEGSKIILSTLFEPPNLA